MSRARSSARSRARRAVGVSLALATVGTAVLGVLAPVAVAIPDASPPTAAPATAIASTVASAPTPTRRIWPTITLAPTSTPVPLPPPPFGRVVYNASRAGSYESLGVPVIACRHRDPAPRKIGVEFFERLGKKVSVFGPDTVPNVPPGKKIIFVSDAGGYRQRDVVIVRVGHFGDGTARVVSDARIIHCMAKMRFKPGVLVPTYWRGMGLYRADTGATPVPVDWSPPHR